MIRILLALVLCIGCAGAQEPAPSVDESSWCYAAVVGGVETVGCAEAHPVCESMRVSAAESAQSVSQECHQVQLRLDRANP